MNPLTRNEWQEQESPWHVGLLISNRSKTPGPTRTISPLNHSQWQISREDKDNSTDKSSRRLNGEDAVLYLTESGLRRNSSPLKALEHRNTSPYKVSENRNTSAFKVSEHRSKHVSPFSDRREEASYETGLDGSALKRNRRTPTR